MSMERLRAHISWATEELEATDDHIFSNHLGEFLPILIALLDEHESEGDRSVWERAERLIERHGEERKLFA